MSDAFKNTDPDWKEQPNPEEKPEDIQVPEQPVSEPFPSVSDAEAEPLSSEPSEEKKDERAADADNTPPSAPNQPQPDGTPAQPNFNPQYGAPQPNGPFRQNPAGQSWQQNYPPRQEFQWGTANYNQQPPQPPKPQKNKGLVIFSIILVVALVFTAGAFVLYAVYQQQGSPFDNSSLPSAASGPSLEINSRPSENEDKTADGKLTDTAIAKKVKPSVVGIVVYVNTGRQYQMYSQGSGIIMSDDGYIVSNAHVFMTEAGNLVDSIQVYLDNGKSFAGKMVGIDTRSDLAVIKINAKNLTKAEFGDSAAVEVGEHVLAIGNPSGMELAGSVTGGMVSAINRQVRMSNGFSMTCIQTDAAINPGNSGGALVNSYGQVIGINSSKIVAENYEGIGFAIASSEAKPIIDSLIKYGYVEGRVKVGITYTEVDEFNAKLNDCPEGLMVEGIDETLPVADSGLQVYDIITKMDGQEVKTTEDVSAFLKNKKPGDVVKMTVYRMTGLGTGRTLTVKVTLAEDRGTELGLNNQNN